MNDLKALTDAFAELERRADNAPRRADARTSRVPRLVPVAAAVLVAAGLVTGVALLAPGGDSGSPSPVRVGASPSTPTPKLPVHSVVPTSARQLEERFRTVLGETATFTVTATGGPVEVDDNGTVRPGSGAAIAGVLTAKGKSGGYDLQIIKGEPGVPQARCDDPDRSDCHLRTLSDGSSLAVGAEPLAGVTTGTTYQVDLVRKDGTEFLLHVSNNRDPKGGKADVLAPRPPLSTDQMVQLVTSQRW